MANTSAKKGDRRERQLVNKANEYPLTTAMRAPSSGSATDRDLPDLLILHFRRDLTTTLGMRISQVWAVEIKADKDGCGRLDHEEVHSLCRFALNSGATPLVAVKPNRKQWSFFEPRELTYADKSRGVTKGMLPGRSFAEVFIDG